MSIETIVIAGGGLAGWMTASVLARQLAPEKCKIIIVEEAGDDTSLGPLVPALATLPATGLFHAEYGYDEDAVLKAAAGSFSLGTAMSGWTRTGSPCFHPFGDAGAPLSHLSFHHMAARLRAEGAGINLANYSLAALCAQTERFTRPPAHCTTVLSTLSYGLTLETKGYADLFRTDALAKDVIEVKANVEHVDFNSTGYINTVSVSTGAAIAGDLFIDCTGAAAKLISGCRGVTFEDWTHWLPCDHVTCTSTPVHSPPQPYVHLTAHDAGWMRHVPTRSKHNEISLFQTTKTTGLPSGASPYRAGCRPSVWQNNCIAMGAAAVLLDPASPLALHLLHSAIKHLVSLLPNDHHCQVEAQQFNRVMASEFECARDFAILPYKINGRVGEPFWDACRTMSVPDRLAHKINLYQKTGRLALYDGEPVEEADWVSLFDSQGIYPQRYDPAANAMPLADIQSHFARVRDIMIREVATMPFHGDYLKSIAL
jgi:tryptophan 7-halogenase